MRTLKAERVVAAVRRGSSCPVIVETAAGNYFTKLRGAAQGTAALVAEIVVAALARALGLRVPQQTLVVFGEALESADRDGELRDLLLASRGCNLGFELLEGARDLRPEEATSIDPDLASKIVWLDALVLNPDRTARNPNILIWRNEPWLIDHGAALGFHHDWPSVTESSPRRTSSPTRHLLLEQATRLAEWDGILAETLRREVIEAAIEEVSDEFLRPLLPPHAAPDALRRRRAAYAAFLWKRLKPPRPFVPRAPR